MKQKIRKGKVIEIAGAFAAWIMGAGFATGQEILQFFTGYGYLSFAVLAIFLLLILWVGMTITGKGFDHKEDEDYLQTSYFCGKHMGKVYDFFIPFSTFAAFICIISGAGAAIEEHFGIPHYIGALILALAAFLAFAAGFEKFVRIAGAIAPVIIGFIIIIGLVTVIRDFEGMHCVEESKSLLSEKKAVPFFWLAAFLYIAYNVTGGSHYYTALGQSAISRKEATLGAALGGIMLILAIGLLNTAMLVNAAECSQLDIPSLYLADRISGILGFIFVVMLLCGMFTTSSAVLWTVATSIGKGEKKRSLIAASVAALAGFIIGLFSFADLISVIYPAIGAVSLIYILCVMSAVFRKKEK